MATRLHRVGNFKSREMAQFYREGYSAVYSTGAVGVVSRILHQSLETGFSREEHFSEVLELGAGQGEHFPFVRHSFDRYLETDLDSEQLVRGHKDRGSRVAQQQLDAQTMENVEPMSVDRLIVTCLLSHLPSPADALMRWRSVMATGGLISLYLPHEPGWALRTSQAFFTARKTQRLGLDYWYAHYREHPFHFPFLRLAVQRCFIRDNVKAFSFPLSGWPWSMNLWTVFQIRISGN